MDDSESQLTVRDARAHFAEVITRAQNGTPTVITRNRRPVAVVVPRDRQLIILVVGVGHRREI